MAGEDIMQMALLAKAMGGGSSKNIVGSLFGLDPNIVAAQQAQQQLQGSRQEAMQYAQLDPYQRANYMMYQGGSGLTGGLMSAIGPENAAVQRAKQEALLKDEMAKQGISLDNPQGYMAGAKLAMNMGLPDVAAKLGMAGVQLDAEMASAEKARRVSAEDQRSNAIWEQAIKDAGGDRAKAAQNLESKEYQMDIQKKLAGRTVVSVTNQQESEFSKTLGKIQGQQMENAYNTRNAAVDTLNTLGKMKELNDKQLISGSFSGARGATANFLNTIGLASQSDAKTLANTQQFEKVAGDLVLANIKKLGYNPSNADVIFLNKTLPNLEASPEARQSLINWMGAKAQASIAEVKNMESYALKNKSLNGYTPTLPNFSPTENKKGIPLTNEQLIAEIARLKGNK